MICIKRQQTNKTTNSTLNMEKEKSAETSLIDAVDISSQSNPVLENLVSQLTAGIISTTTPLDAASLLSAATSNAENAQINTADASRLILNSLQLQQMQLQQKQQQLLALLNDVSSGSNLPLHLLNTQNSTPLSVLSQSHNRTLSQPAQQANLQRNIPSGLTSQQHNISQTGGISIPALQLLLAQNPSIRPYQASLLGQSLQSQQPEALISQQPSVLSLSANALSNDRGSTPAPSSLLASLLPQLQASSNLNVAALQQQSQQQPVSSNEAPSVKKNVSSRGTHSYRSIILFNEQDDEALSHYQAFLRKQIEIFEATETDVRCNSRGRNRGIVLGQVGIRCRHCGKLPFRERAKGAVFFPSRMVGLYQTAQNMANTHLIKYCTKIPKDARENLMRVRKKEQDSKNTCKSAHGAGRYYWASCLRIMGVVETEDMRLKFDESADIPPSCP